MSPVTHAFVVASSLFTLVLVIGMLRKGRLRERHAIWWIVGGVLALTVSVFPTSLEWAMSLLGVTVGANLVFFVSIALLVLVAIQHSSELTRIESQVRRLAEDLVILRMNSELGKQLSNSHTTEAENDKPQDPMA